VIEAALPAARAAHFAATLLIEGCVLFHFFVAPSGAKDDFRHFLNRTMAVAWIVAVISGIAWWLLLAAQIDGSSITEALADGTAWTLLTQTQFGTAWMLRTLGFVLLSISLFKSRRQSKSPLIPAQAGTGRTGEGLCVALSIVLSVALTASLAWSGHGAATPGAKGGLHLAADVLHLIASGIWLGGLLPYAILLAMRPDRAAETTRRFSLLATVSVLVLLPTGIVNGWMILPSLDALTGTLYGQLLLAKIGLFLLMLAFAGVNRFVLTPRLASANSDNARRRLIIHSGCEIALGLSILALVGVLGTLAPVPEEQHHHAMAALSYSLTGGGASAAGPRSGRSSIASRKPMPHSATKAQAANT
jgi:putative copper resistance protein D